jgi:hypothetical protein
MKESIKMIDLRFKICGQIMPTNYDVLRLEKSLQACYFALAFFKIMLRSRSVNMRQRVYFSSENYSLFVKRNFS